MIITYLVKDIGSQGYWSEGRRSFSGLLFRSEYTEIEVMRKLDQLTTAYPDKLLELVKIYRK